MIYANQCKSRLRPAFSLRVVPPNALATAGGYAVAMRSSSPAEFDAVVIGGGPAGAMSALLLARLGWRVALIERRERGETKACGHCLNPCALAILQRIGIDQQALEEAALTDRLLVYGAAPSPLALELRHAGGRAGAVVSRARLDQLMRDHAAAAGALLMQPATATIGVSEEGGCLVNARRRKELIQLRTPLVIGADGVGSRVARALGLAHRDGAGRKFGFSFDIEAHAPHSLDPGAIHMFVMPNGYMGIVRQREHEWHVAALVSNSPDNSSRNPIDFVRETAARHQALRPLGLNAISPSAMRQFAAIGPMPWRPLSVANHLCVLVGDAAGYIEPFTGEGIGWALRSAEVLAEVASHHPPGMWNEKSADEYTHLWRQHIGARQRFCCALAFALERKRVTNFVLCAGLMFPYLARRTVAHVLAA